MSIAIRDYQPSDSEAGRSLLGELAQHHADIYEDPAIASGDSGQGFEEYVNNTAHRGAWVAELDDRVVAFAGLIVHGEEGEVEPVVVSSSYRSMGIGTILIRHVVQEAKKKGIRFLSIRPVARNEKALSLFVRLGFNLVGHVDLFQDLSLSSGRKWRPGIVIHGNELHY